MKNIFLKRFRPTAWITRLGYCKTVSGESLMTRYESGLTLIEVIVAMVLIQLLIVPILLIMSNLNNYFARATQYSQALFLTQRNLEISAHLAQTKWNAISAVNNSPQHFVKNSDNWELASGQDVTTDIRYATWVTIESVCHDPEYKELKCDLGGALIPDAVRVISTTEWKYHGAVRDVTLESVYTEIF